MLRQNSLQASKQARAQQEELIRQVELRRRMRATVVPTNDGEVCKILRQAGEPITLFGEREVRTRWPAAHTMSKHQQQTPFRNFSLERTALDRFCIPCVQHATCYSCSHELCASTRTKNALLQTLFVGYLNMKSQPARLRSDLVYRLPGSNGCWQSFSKSMALGTLQRRTAIRMSEPTV